MPTGTYAIESSSQYALSSGLFQDLSILYYSELTITSAKSTTLSYPKLYELNGVITSPAAYPPWSVYGENRPTGTANSVAALVRTGSENDYLIALVPGSSWVALGLVGPFSDTWYTDIDFYLPYTMPSATTRKNFTVPTVPTFRTITGVIKTPTGAAAADVSITAWMSFSTVPTAGVFIFTGHAVTDANGAFTLKLPDGVYTVSANP
jgi:hypothetical protein